MMGPQNMFGQVAFLAEVFVTVCYFALEWFLTGVGSQVIKEVVDLVEGLPIAQGAFVELDRPLSRRVGVGVDLEF
jgi:hypothetical protein